MSHGLFYFNQAYRRSLRALGVALVIVLLALAPSKALGQSCPAGDFFELDTWFIAANQSTGVLPIVGGTQLRLDTNGNGQINEFDRTFTTPEVLAPPFLASATLRLSPTRQFLYAVGGQQAGTCSDVTVRFYLLPPFPSTTLELVHEACFENIQRTRIFYDYQLLQTGSFLVGSGSRIAAILHQPFAGDSTLTLFDLNRPGPAGRVDVHNLHAGIGEIRIAQGSQAIFIQHDLALVGPTGADYTVVSLCPNSFGQVVNPGGGFLQNIEGGPLDATVGTSANGLTNINFTQNGAPITTLPVPDCCATSTVPPTVASLTLGITAAPASLNVGQTITYTLRVANAGPAAAANVVVEAGIHFNTTFVSATGGGTQTGNMVEWTMPSLPAGSGPATVSYTVRAECDITDYFARAPNVNAIASNAARVFAGVALPGPQVRIPATDLLVMTSTITPDIAPPLRAGDTITIALNIVNSSANDHAGVRFVSPLSTFGDYLTLDSVISVNRGTLTQPTPTSMTWHGDIPAGQALVIVLRVRVFECLPHTVVEVYPFGGLSIRNACDVFVLNNGFFISNGPFAIVRDLQVTMGIAPVQVGAIGPVSAEHQAVRLGAPLPIGLTIANASASTITNVNMRMVIPAALTVGVPALVGVVPPGASYDPLTRVVSFAGDVPAGSTINVRVAVAIVTAVPRIETIFEGGVATCVSTRSRLVICPVPAVPTGPALFGLDRAQGVWVMEFGVDTAPRPFFGPALDAAIAFDYVAGGPMWIAGSEFVRFDPATLDLTIFPRGAINTQQGLIPLDAVLDRASGDVLVSGTVRSGFHAALVRSNADASVVTDIVTDQVTLAILGSMAPTATGGVAVCSLPSRVDNRNSGRGVLVPNIAGLAVDYAVAPTIPNPSLTFGFTPPGNFRGTYPVAIAPVSTLIGQPGESTELWAVVASQWVQGSQFSFVSATSVYSLVRVNPASAAITPVIDLIAGDVAVGFFQPPAVPSYPTPLTPLNLTIIGGSTGNVGTSVATAPGGGVFVASRSALWRIESPLAGASAALVTAFPVSGYAETVDLVALNIGVTATAPSCGLADVASDSLDTVRNPNNAIGPEDLDAFIAGFIAENTAIADVASDSLDTTYNPNGFVGPEDLDAFIASFIVGC